MPAPLARHPRPRPRVGGFTLLELLVVVAIIAASSAAVSLSLRDGSETILEREALRLSAMLERARAQSRASGVPVRWSPVAGGFVIEGLPGGRQTERWLGPDIDASAQGTVWLGPEPIIGRQQLTLTALGPPQRVVRIGTDGVRPFAPEPLASATPSP